MQVRHVFPGQPSSFKMHYLLLSCIGELSFIKLSFVLGIFQHGHVIFTFYIINISPNLKVIRKMLNHIFPDHTVDNNTTIFNWLTSFDRSFVGPVSLHWLIREVHSYQTLHYLGIGLKHKTLYKD